MRLGTGLRTLKIKNREDGSSFDELLLAKDKGFMPAGPGEPALAAPCR